MFSVSMLFKLGLGVLTKAALFILFSRLTKIIIYAMLLVFLKTPYFLAIGEYLKKRNSNKNILIGN